MSELEVAFSPAAPDQMASALAAERYDVLVIERRASEIDVGALLEGLQQPAGGLKIPVLVVANGPEKERRAWLAAGVHDVLPLPVEAVELSCKLRQCLELSLLRAESREKPPESLAQRNVETRLAQSQKMEALGILAGAIAHDFNNILAVILSFAGFASEGLSPSERRYADINEVIKAANRAARLTRQLLSVTSQQPTHVEPTDLNQQVTDLHNAIRRAAGPKVDVRVTLSSRPAIVQIDPVQFDQLLLNLVVNAREAMPQGGALQIRLEVDAAREAERRVRLLIIDTGHGMDPETQRRIFEPFFTTKEKGNGAGLGLAACFSIIEAARGTIDVKSAPGEGSTFTVELPLTSAAVVVRPQAPLRSDTTRNGETILLVEDEATLLGALVRVFESAGYRVRSATNGRDAQRIIDELGSALDAVVSDVVIPEVGGYEVATYAAKIAPNAVIYLTSGYLDGAHGDGEFPVLWKPIPPRDIVRTVNGALAARVAKAPLAEPGERASGVVLVVEDDEAAQQALSRLLKSAGFVPKVSGSVTEARSLVESAEPEIVLCDLSLADGSGVELLEFLQKTRPALCSRVFVLTGSIAEASSRLEVAGMTFPVISKLTAPAELLRILSATRPPSLAPESAAPHVQEQSASPRSSEHAERVLIVESEVALARATARILGPLGVDVRFASTGEDARQAMLRGNVDAVVMDLALPDADGAALLDELRRNQPDLGAVLLTGTRNDRAAAQASRVDTTELLTRPFEPEALRAALRSVIKASRSARVRRQLLAAHHGVDDFLSDLPRTSRDFEYALQKISLGFQPIVRTRDGSVFGYEALLRCSEPSFASPSRLLAAAQILGRVHELGRKVRSAVTRTLLEHPERNDVIFVNVDPAELNDELLVAPNDPLLPFARRVVLEISERAAHAAPGIAFEQRLAVLREHGYRLALDDLGEGYVGLSSLNNIRPEIAKIDMSLVRRVQDSPLKRDIIASVLWMARSAGIVVAAEGVESREEAKVLSELGCDLMQGYFFAEPGPAFPELKRAWPEVESALEGRSS
jgi:EAL domain-containing protein (putative c-di-GMP-specific phosphodiesterase class I)/signal transduction histidine kinase/ActR/RegA family two-component response regulator